MVVTPLKCEGHHSGACHPSVQLKAKPGPKLGLAKQEERSQYLYPYYYVLLTPLRRLGLANYCRGQSKPKPAQYADPPPTCTSRVRTRMSRPAHYRNYRFATISEVICTVHGPHNYTSETQKWGKNIITDVSYQSPRHEPRN